MSLISWRCLCFAVVRGLCVVVSRGDGDVELVGGGLGVLGSGVEGTEMTLGLCEPGSAASLIVSGPWCNVQSGL